MKTKKIIIVSIISLLLMTGLFLTVFALLHGKSDTPVVNNLMSDKDGDPTINETFKDNVKKDVTVTNNLDYSVFVRAVVVVSWKKASDPLTVYPVAPVAGTDYSVTYNSTDWFQKNGYWYCINPVLSGATSSALITTCSQTGTAPDGYVLSVEIVAQTIQAQGTTDTGDIPAVTDAWGVAVDSNGNLTNQ